MPAFFALCFRAEIPRAIEGTNRRSCFASGKSRSLMTSTMSRAVSHLSGALPCRSELRLGIEIDHRSGKIAILWERKKIGDRPNESERPRAPDQRLFFRALLFLPP